MKSMGPAYFGGLSVLSPCFDRHCSQESSQISRCGVLWRRCFKTERWVTVTASSVFPLTTLRMAHTGCSSLIIEKENCSDTTSCVWSTSRWQPLRHRHSFHWHKSNWKTIRSTLMGEYGPITPLWLALQKRYGILSEREKLTITSTCSQLPV